MKTFVLQKAIGIIVLVFAFFTLSSGLAVQGISLNFWASKEVGNVVKTANAQEINMAVTYRGYSPNVFKLQAGVPVKWIIDGQQVSGCTNEIIVPDLNIRQDIYPGQNIIEFTPQEPGTISFSCWMGMVRGKFIVE